DAAILPRIVPLGDIDEDEIAFAEAATAELAEPALQLPPPLAGLDRETPLVANNPATAFALAKDLARLMDDMTTRQVDWARLDQLVPEEFDEYWKQTLAFLKFIRQQWPAILQASN